MTQRWVETTTLTEKHKYSIIVKYQQGLSMPKNQFWVSDL